MAEDKKETEKTEESSEEQPQNLEAIMGLIMNGGNAKSSAFEAINAAKKGDYKTADAKLKESDGFLTAAHNSQTGMLTDEANGIHAKVTLLTVHSQDHIMNAITFRDLAGEIVDLYKRLDGVKVED
ncbi:PTS system, cellobiose-specific IIA component [Pediococcus damnosus]|uniref:PTS system, cellobiose-specific IIA component n=3 Tax=Pediococcus damnosus TaxID=51663 RepID=A0A0R2HNH3_9LACO|nr:PTS lactose/cellobiose transporter subunit IIA [Pediococcus damnosus]AMV60742.1 PTS system, cellobiose-specific IIA component [Pediococcus damnosus]AMV63334.1 PTS system, cellobiose-specific IIA component [Pediococcus damnosus]AMV65054.1 PTS system, cellobiose-specific IIA component [Pediococcus damnosus]AMV66765.1 PTS system, cellobiose-specific IIA component [Pediococcus damnosus]AMV69870.1 PTS system, cellobiose-specific IIA component [Pediococcus damnosus]